MAGSAEMGGEEAEMLGCQAGKGAENSGGKQGENSKYRSRAVIIDRDPGSMFHPIAIW
jgi:hypothetical protein